MKVNTDVCLCLKKDLQLVTCCAVSCEEAQIIYSNQNSIYYSVSGKNEGRAASGSIIEGQDQLKFTFQGLNDVLKLNYNTNFHDT